ncbi:GNAT family N-acetyltransferase [Saccharopolyspora halophila]|uniref:GNAT family N-acetyltransferase n=1 Tax=Saccharopolyspora halophila TaxID=405551 RepID=A0ABP5T666_9PSEU
MAELAQRQVGRYAVREAGPADANGARSVMLDTFYNVFGHGYRPRWHGDVIDMDRAYFSHPRQALFVAALNDEVVGTTAVRADGPKSPPHAPWLAERYPSGSTAQVFRVYIRPEHRRNGLARELVDLACRFVARTPGYERIYLHTNVEIEGAEPFWRSIGTEIHDGRTDPAHSPAVHFEIPIPVSGDQQVSDLAMPAGHSIG